MKIAIQPLDEGPLDFNRKSGDIVKAYLDSDPQPGGQEKKSWLIVEFPDPVNQAGNPFPAAYLNLVRDDFLAQEFAAGATPDANLVRRERKYSIPNFRSRFDANELVLIDDANQLLPDGGTSQGGTVTAGVVSGLFTFADIVRK